MRRKTSTLILTAAVLLMLSPRATMAQRANGRSHIRTMQMPRHAFETDQTEPLLHVEGDTLYYDLSAYYVMDETGRLAFDQGFYQPVCFGPNDEVYFQRLLPRVCTNNSWIEGRIVDGEVKLELPQLTDIGPDGRRYYIGAWVQNALTGQWESVDYAYFEMSEDRSYLRFIDYGNIFLMGYDNYGNVWEQDRGLEAVLFEEEVAQLPADAKPEAYKIRYYNAESKEPEERITRVAFCGDDVYLRGLAWLMPEVWVQGYMEGQTIHVPTAQYVGNNGNYITHFYTASDKQGSLQPTGEMTFTMNQDGSILRSSRNDYQMLGYSEASIETRTYNASYTRFSLVPATPEEPTLSEYADGELTFYLPTYDVDGNDIDPSLLSWRLYVNHRPYTFTTERYPTLASDLDEIPYGFVDATNFLYSWEGFALRLMADGVYLIEMESVYRVDGEERVSARAALQVGDISTGIEEIGQTAASTANGQAPALNGIYDLMGRRVQGKTKGLLIKTETKADGSIVRRKVSGGE